MKTVKFNVDFNGQLPQFKNVKAGTVMEVEDGHARALLHRQVVTELGPEHVKPKEAKPVIEQKEEKVVFKTKEEKAVKVKKK